MFERPARNPPDAMEEPRIIDSIEELDETSRYLVHKAKAATSTSYAPYSNFHVGAAVMLESGIHIEGSNQENASYPLCMCAERVALYAVSAVHPGSVITRLAVVAHKKGHKELVAATPCGACRQVMVEYEQRQGKPYEVVLLGPGGKWHVFPSAANLLPMAFDRNILLR